MNDLTIETLFRDNKNRLKLEILNNEASFNKKIYEKEIHRPGLALTGFVDVFTYNRIQIIGNTELAYLETLSPEERNDSLQKILEFDLPCIVVTDNNFPPQDLISIANGPLCPNEMALSKTAIYFALLIIFKISFSGNGLKHFIFNTPILLCSSTKSLIVPTTEPMAMKIIFGFL